MSWIVIWGGNDNICVDAEEVKAEIENAADEGYDEDEIFVFPTKARIKFKLAKPQELVSIKL